MTHEQLEDEKLRQEVLNLQQDRSVIGDLGPWITAAVAVVGVLLTWLKQLADTRQQQRENARQQEADRRASKAGRKEEARQRELDRQQQQAAMEQREAESQRRLQESFSTVAVNLGSNSPSIQASAAASILSFLRPEHSAFHEQVFLLVLANLKVDHDPEVNKLLVRVFERALRLQLQAGTLDRSLALDLTRARLETVDLVGLDLSDADIAFANLRYGNLRGAKLRRLRGYDVHLEKASLSGAETILEEARLRKAHCAEAQFHDANLVSARLEEADLTGAEFQRARLQSAHLDETVLIGTRFEEADLNDAFLRRLRDVDEAALRSLSRAKNWRGAHFDPEIRERLEGLSLSPAPAEQS
jgi:uncharacterized protein YjbI with pentapeptide repeats